MQPATTYPALTRRGLILHDALAFLALLATSVALFGVTLFLFRSFEQHRADLAVRWAERGRIALQQGKPDAAVTALRTALSYAPDERANQLLLAQALAKAGHTEEATNYFLNLWDARPGDGFINLQLARLARQKGDYREATDDYRASIFGSWEGDGVVRRREVRLELSDFLIQQHLNAEARNELFTVAGNAPNNPDLNLTVALKLEAAGYLPDAFTFLQKAVAADPHNRAILEQAGQAAYTLGDYPTADHLLHRALDEPPYSGETIARQQQFTSLAGDAKRIQELSLALDQPATARAAHILTAAKIAQARLRTCLVSPGTAPHNDPLLDDLNARWTTAQSGTNATRRALLDNADAQNTWTQLIYLTERNTAQVCGVPAGDDALLLQLANTAEKGQGTNGK